MNFYRTLFTLFLFVTSLHVYAVTGRNPTGVNVSSHGPTTVFITFQGLAAGDQVVAAFWCGDVVAVGWLPLVGWMLPFVSGCLLLR